MKKLMLLMFLLPFLAVAQTEIPKGSDKITIINNHTASENFLLAKQILADQDIEIATQDKDIFQIKTGKIRASDNGTFSYLINCRDNKVTMTGTWGSNLGLNIGGLTSGPSLYAIQYKGTQKFMFNQMNDIAKQIGVNLEYSNTIVYVKPKKSYDDVYGN
jgi:hypothetical protein